MKRLIIVFVPLLFWINGCLLLEKVEYSIEMKSTNSGKATVIFSNLRSDAIGNREFAEDTTQLFGYYLTSLRFADSMGYYGKKVLTRELKTDNGMLHGILKYEFDDITVVEQIQHEGGFYYLTLQTDDSVITTNGSIVPGEEYKRILWKDTEKTLKFTISAGNFNPAARGLSQYWEKR